MYKCGKCGSSMTNLESLISNTCSTCWHQNNLKQEREAEAKKPKEIIIPNSPMTRLEVDEKGVITGMHIANDAINHPEHYTSHPSGIECIEVTRHMSFAAGNVIKYLWRNGLKDGEPSLKDLKKAAWYLNDMIDQLETNGE